MIGIDDVAEKDLNLKISLLLKEKLEKDGLEVVLTRTEDKGLYLESSKNHKVMDMQKRCEIIAKTKPFCTISIHQNSYPDSGVKGPQVFYFSHSVEAAALAASVQTRLNEDLKVKRPRVEKGNTSYYLLKRSESTTIIVECGFLSNEEEKNKLMTPDYQKDIVGAIGKGLFDYIETRVSKR